MAATRQRPLRIGVSARIQYGDPAKPGYLGKNVFFLEQNYAQFIAAHDALPLLVPALPAADAPGLRRTGLTLADYAAELDGLMLQGGTDISPLLYGEEPLQPQWAGDPPRDRYELELLRQFIAARKPVLGICRGHQMLNVALGGTLYQDTLTQLPGSQPHADRARYHDHHHDIDIAAGTRLAQLYGRSGRARVSSIHHQAVKDPGRDLVVEARAGDGVIEAIRYTGGQYLVGVQWHPEFHHAGGAGMLDGTPLIEEFLAAARAGSA